MLALISDFNIPHTEHGVLIFFSSFLKQIVKDDADIIDKDIER